MADIHPGLLKYKTGNQYTNQKNDNFYIKDKIWKNLSNQFDQIRLIEPENDTRIFWKMTKHLMDENFSKTDIFSLGRTNRKNISFKKYELNALYNKKDLKIFDKKLFISDDLNIVRNLYTLYKKKLYYYFRDNLWLISSEPINDNNSKFDLEILSNHYEFDLNKKNKLNFQNKKNPLSSMGWIKRINSNGLIADGFYSTVNFKTKGNNCSQDSKIIIEI